MLPVLYYFNYRTREFAELRNYSMLLLILEIYHILISGLFLRKTVISSYSSGSGRAIARAGLLTVFSGEDKVEQEFDIDLQNLKIHRLLQNKALVPDRPQINANEKAKVKREKAEVCVGNR